MKGLIISSNVLLILFLFPSFCFEDCRAIDTISITEPIKDPNTIVSAGQTFKLGFFSPANTNNRYVGIMFNIPVQTVMWVANREKPLNDSNGILTISEDGSLVVLNGNKEKLWSSNSPKSLANSSAQLLDTGNLVLNNSNGTTVWESFQIPTDSVVRSMRTGGNESNKIQLTSWRSPSDPSIGSFSLGINFLREIPEIFIWNRSEIYWRSGPWNGDVFIGIHDMRSRFQNRIDKVTDNTGTYFTYNNFNSSTLLHYELSSSGAFQQKDLDGKGNWNVIWSSIRSECDVYGKCGQFGTCNPRSSPICKCLQGFEARDKDEWSRGNWSGGCLRNALLQCERNDSVGQEGEGDGYLRLGNMKVPDLSHPVPILEEECGNDCLNNCSCTAYAYHTGVGCLHWDGNLIDIQQFSSVGADLYIHQAKSKGKNKAIIAATVSVGSLIFLAAALYLLWKCLTKHKGKKQEAELSLIEIGEVSKSEIMGSHNSEKSKLEELPLYSYETLANATDNFLGKNMLGKGGFGPVFKGKLSNGQEIAVKRLSNSSTQGSNEFMNEVVVISKLQHRNLVKLLGCCVEREEKMLVYEYMSNKSLDAYLFDSRKQDLLLDWHKRAITIEGIGRGLLYLHRDSRLRIIHRDLKASNILLNEELNPKILDFGLARIFGGNQDEANTNRVVGTYGYMAPEYAMGGSFSEKSDIYSFGVLLLEIVSGKRNTSFYHAEEELSLVGHAWKLWNANETVKLVDTAIFDPKVEMEILRCVHVGLLCVQERAIDRPNMSTVLLMLNSEFGELSAPKLPAYTTRLSLTEQKHSPEIAHSVNDISLTTIQGRQLILPWCICMIVH